MTQASFTPNRENLKAHVALVRTELLSRHAELRALITSDRLFDLSSQSEQKAYVKCMKLTMVLNRLEGLSQALDEESLSKDDLDYLMNL